MTPSVLALALGLGCAGAADTLPGEPPGVPRVAALAVALAAPRAAAVSAAVPAAEPPVVDRWIAEDKLRHFTLSFAAVQMGYGGARMLVDRETAVPLAAGVGLFLGVAKEVRDVRAGRHFSLKDLAWDLAGVALAVAFVRRIE